MSGDQRRSRVGVGTGDSQAESNLRYRRLRSPVASEQSLQIPPLAQTISSWNDRIQPSSEIEVGGLELSSLQRLGRSELLDRAMGYSARYRDVDLADRDAQSIVMSGHQPLLFHPGVWFKNFALSSVGLAVGATPVNLVVDNDVCGSAAIKCPAFKDGRASTGLIDIDAAAAAMPYETRPIVDVELFASFADRASKSLKDCLAALGKDAEPLVSSLWPHVLSAKESLGDSASLGAVLAAGRHRLEQEIGLQTLEVPVSTVAQTEAFCHFAAAIMKEQSRFNASYNARLIEYRQLHRIRSSAHPVPELEQNDGWLESPFWVWRNAQPQRQRLFLKESGGTITLTDRAGWELVTKSVSLANTLSEMAGQQIAIRPRALITTLYSRLVLSDLFLHGIGGAKYDQLTDLIAIDFFDVALPVFSALTATMHLPFGHPLVSPHDRSELRNQIRQRRFHPERFIDSSDAEDLILRKRTAIENSTMNRFRRHQEIEEANQSMQPFVADQIEALQQKLFNAVDQIRNSRVLNSREYSFCLFPESLIDDLKQMASPI